MLTVFDRPTLRKAFACFPSGITAVCALDGDKPIGITASSFTSVSLDPPLVSICIAQTSQTRPTLTRQPRIGVSVLSEHHSATASALSDKGSDRFATVGWEAAEDGAVFISGSPLWLDCSIEQVVLAGDHDIVLLRIHALQADPGIRPIIFHSSAFRRLAAVE